jgi:hypothetical protein
MSKANVVFGILLRLLTISLLDSAQSLGISKQAAYEATGTLVTIYQY